jgi:hypothetical protein
MPDAKKATRRPVSKTNPRGAGRPAGRVYSEVLYLRITPALLESLRKDCEAHRRDTGINASPTEMARKILVDHYKSQSARR